MTDGPTDPSGDGGRVASHYRGAAADRYLAYQRSIGELGATLNRWKFADRVGPGDRVVDFGCGTGGLLAGLPARERIGVEVSEPARAAAAERGLTVYATAAELPDGCADVVISNHALEHATAPLEELRQLRRALAPGGRLVLWLPLDDWRVQRRPDPADPDHHLYAWTPRLLANLLAEAGFEEIDCRAVARAWPPRARLLVRLPRPLFEALGRVWAVVRRRRQLTATARRPAT